MKIELSNGRELNNVKSLYIIFKTESKPMHIDCSNTNRSYMFINLDEVVYITID